MRGLRAPLFLAALACILAALPASAATTSAVARVAVAGPGVTSAFPKGVSIELHAPPGYVRGTTGVNAGTWLGPEYWASGDSSMRGRTSITWKVAFVHGSKSGHAVARAGLKMGWRVRFTDPIAVPQVVGGRAIGVLLGAMVLSRATRPLNASYEGSLAFPVAPHAYALVRFILDQPPSNSAGSAGNYLVNGEVSAAAWQRGQAYWALTGVRLVGTLPPKEVLVGTRGTLLHGMVHDSFSHPVPRAKLALQRYSSGWRTVSTTRASRLGRFHIGTRGGGLYRVRASAAGAAATSRAIRIR